MTDTTPIRLSDAAPVRVRTSSWGVHAEARSPGGHAWLRVRQHTDERRTIVYGENEDAGLHAGYLLGSTERAATTEEIVRAIRRVAGAIRAGRLGDDCIADLPPEELE